MGKGKEEERGVQGKGEKEENKALTSSFVQYSRIKIVKHRLNFLLLHTQYILAVSSTTNLSNQVNPKVRIYLFFLLEHQVYKELLSRYKTDTFFSLIKAVNLAKSANSICFSTHCSVACFQGEEKLSVRTRGVSQTGKNCIWSQ